MEAAARRDARRVRCLALQDELLHLLDLGHDGEQGARVGMPWVREQLLGGPLLDDPPEVHHRDPVGDVPREPEVVRDDEDRDPGISHQLEHELEDLAAHRGIEARHRLVGDEE